MKQKNQKYFVHTCSNQKYDLAIRVVFRDTFLSGYIITFEIFQGCMKNFLEWWATPIPIIGLRNVVLILIQRKLNVRMTAAETDVDILAAPEVVMR